MSHTCIEYNLLMFLIIFVSNVGIYMLIIDLMIILFVVINQSFDNGIWFTTNIEQKPEFLYCTKLIVITL